MKVDRRPVVCSKLVGQTVWTKGLNVQWVCVDELHQYSVSGLVDWSGDGEVVFVEHLQDLQQQGTSDHAAEKSHLHKRPFFLRC